MPFVEIHMLEGRTDEQKEKLVKAVTDAVADILKVPKEGVWIRIDEMPRSLFAAGGTLSKYRK